MSERVVKRKIVKEKEYKVSSLENGNLRYIKNIKRKGKISERDLEKELNVQKVVLEEVGATYETYAMTVNEFMKYAKLIKTENK